MPLFCIGGIAIGSPVHGLIFVFMNILFEKFKYLEANGINKGLRVAKVTYPSFVDDVMLIDFQEIFTIN